MKTITKDHPLKELRCPVSDNEAPGLNSITKQPEIWRQQLFVSFSILFMLFSTSSFSQSSGIIKNADLKENNESLNSNPDERQSPQSQIFSHALAAPAAVCNVTGNPILCEGGANTFSAPSGAGLTYSWALVNNNTGSIITGPTTNQTITVVGGVPPGTVDLQLTLTSGGISSICKLTLTMIQAAPCTIFEGGAICPGTSKVYTARSGMDHYTWTVTGSATIIGSDTGQTVTVLAGQVCNGNYILHYVFVKSGCSFNCTQVITVADTTAPTLLFPGGNTTILCTSTPVFTPPLAVDACDPNPSVVVVKDTVIPGRCPGAYTRTITWRAVDACGNQSPNTVSQSITVIDNVGPTISTAGVNHTIYCPAVPQFTPPTATDNCDPNPLVIQLSDIITPGSCPGNYTETKTWKVEDACGNNSLVHPSQTITVIDTTAPVITCPGDRVLTCGSPSDTAHTGRATATDFCSNPISITYADAATTSGCAGNGINRTWTATDDCGNLTSCVQHITFTDTVPPVFTSCPAGGALGCNPVVPGSGNATATDNCGTPAITSSVVVTSNGCNRTSTRTYTATDACLNTATCVQVYTYTVDTIAPVITATGTTLILACNPSATAIEAALGSATATDACGQVTPTATTGTVTSNGCSRSQVRTWNATDACGNTALAVSRTITWTRDSIAPVIVATGTTLTLSCNPSATAIEAALGSATATDACGPVTPTATTGTVTSNGCSRSQVRTWNATDACGNTALAVSRTITWTLDTVAPVITATGTSLTLGCNPSATAIDAALGSATAIDACGPVTPTATTATVVVNGCSRSQVRTWNATDACGNTALAVSRTITWSLDTVAPVITATGTTLTLGCNPSVTAIDGALGSATASDACGPVTPIATTGAVISNGCSRSRTRTWNVTDACGNTALTVSRTITWTRDTVAPIITATGTTLLLGCNPSALSIDSALGTATATDDCGPVTPTATTGTATSNGCARSQVRTWNATDACGNTALAVSRTITWTLDTIAPVITATGTSLTLGCNPSALSIDSALGSATAIDACGPVIPTATTATVIANGCSRSQVRTWNATDACGNTALAVSRTITWSLDTVAPVITATGTTLTLGCNPSPTAIDGALGTATATDACGPVTPTATTGALVSNGCSRSRTRTWNVTDACGNTALTVSRTITWTRDTVAPIITATGTTLLLGCNPSALSIDSALGTATATDDCGQVTPTATTGTVTSNGCSRSQVRTWNATDACGNTALAVSRTITWSLDTVAPVITATGTSLTLGCNPSATAIDAALGSATAIDACGPVTPVATTATVVVNGCSYSQVRTWNAADACGNTALAVSRTITWTHDTIAPVITASGTSLTLGCNPSALSIDSALGSATATDDCGPLTPTATTATVVVNGCSYSQVRTWNATDACGNAALAVSRTITWTLDTIAPVITASGTSLTLGCNPSATAIDAALGSATATDACGPVTPTATTATALVNGCSYSQVRTWNATDACGNTALAVSRTITWTVDTIAPVITATGSALTLGCNPSATAIDSALGSATATDGCGPVTPTATTGTVLVNGCSYSQVRTWNATDACGNTALAVSRTITWTSLTTPPVITCPADVALACGSASDTAHTGSATAASACGVTTITYTDATAAAGCAGTGINRTWTAIDACGNQSTCLQLITFVDNTPPVIVCPPAISLTCGSAIDTAVTGRATATDNCSGTVVITFTDVESAPTCAGTGFDRNWTATDVCGNQSSCSQHITFTDNVAPVIVCPGDVVLTCGSPSDVAHTGSATATDNCSAVVMTHTDAACTIGCGGGILRTWVATDASGNFSGCVQHITFIGTSLPVIVCPANISIACGSSSDTAYTGHATATNDCSGAPTVTYTDSASVAGCAGTGISRTWTATDACGNHASCVQQITFVDTVAPAMICGENITLPCSADAVLFSAPVVTDLCDANPVLVIVSDTAVTNADGSVTHTRSWSATDACGNSASCQQAITVLSVYLPFITPSGSRTICAGGNVELCASTGSSYAWNTGSTTQCITVDSAGTYWADVTSSGNCIGRTDSIAVTVSPLPDNTITGDTVLFLPTGQLCGLPGLAYSWSNGDTTQCTTVSDSGNYCLTVTNALGCSSQTCIHVLRNGLSGDTTSNCPITGDTLICHGGSSILTAASGYTSYLWSNGATTQSITAHHSGTFTVVATGPGTCTSSKTVSTLPAPSATITGNHTICTGVTTLCAPAGYVSYLWSTGETSECITTDRASTYTVTVTDSNGCSGTANVCVTSGLPHSGISGNPVVCMGHSTSLCASSGNASYLWNTGATSRCISVNAAGTYTVTVTNSAGCSGTSSINVTVMNCDHHCINDRAGIPHSIDVLAYPNPFSSIATLEFKNATQTAVRGTVEIFASDGTRMVELFNGNMEPDKDYLVKWDAQNASEGTYTYKIVCGETNSTGTLVLMKK